MSRSRVALLSVGVTIVVTLLLVAVSWAAMKLIHGAGRHQLLEECDVDPTLSGMQGYCVTVVRYPSTPVDSERVNLEIAAVHDGAASSHRLVLAYPFDRSRPGDPLEIDLSESEEQIVVTDPSTGSSITYTADQYEPTR
ncbi:hypothetical protein FXB39_11540 [Nocardioides sp. BGMRC 2183]|nr:hypothetical protein FXB39_11540 [Nocardioides sp. BGMRC 2183]